MKRFSKYTKTYLLALTFMVLGGMTFAQSQQPLNVVAQLEEKIMQLELDMLDLKAMDKKSMTKLEKKKYKVEKRGLRRTLANYNDQLDRLTSPRFVSYAPYGGGYYNAYNSPYRYRRYPVRTQVVVAQPCPAPAVVQKKTVQRTPARKAEVRRPVRRPVRR